MQDMMPAARILEFVATCFPSQAEHHLGWAQHVQILKQHSATSTSGFCRFSTCKPVTAAQSPGLDSLTQLRPQRRQIRQPWCETDTVRSCFAKTGINLSNVSM